MNKFIYIKAKSKDDLFNFLIVNETSDDLSRINDLVKINDLLKNRRLKYGKNYQKYLISLFNQIKDVEERMDKIILIKSIINT